MRGPYQNRHDLSRIFIDTDEGRPLSGAGGWLGVRARMSCFVKLAGAISAAVARLALRPLVGKLNVLALSSASLTDAAAAAGYRARKAQDFTVQFNGQNVVPLPLVVARRDSAEVQSLYILSHMPRKPAAPRKDDLLKVALHCLDICVQFVHNVARFALLGL